VVTDFVKKRGVSAQALNPTVTTPNEHDVGQDSDVCAPVAILLLGYHIDTRDASEIRWGQRPKPTDHVGRGVLSRAERCVSEHGYWPESELDVVLDREAQHAAETLSICAMNRAACQEFGEERARRCFIDVVQEQGERSDDRHGLRATGSREVVCAHEVGNWLSEDLTQAVGVTVSEKEVRCPVRGRCANEGLQHLFLVGGFQDDFPQWRLTP